jgi:uncharacterized protein (TIGR04255 family)
MIERVRPPGLPDFDNPPIDEVAIGVQFHPIPLYGSELLGQFRETVQDEYPGYVEQPRLEPVIESLTETSASPTPPFSVSISQPPGSAAVRSWLVSADDSELLQIQDSMFTLNWRRRDSEYPRFETLLERFESTFGKFKTLLTTRGIQMPQLRQIEVAYINWITDMPMYEFLKSAHETGISEEEFPDDQAWQARYTLKENGSPLARLLVQCVPGLRIQEPNPGRGSQLGLTFRAPLPPGNVSDARLMHLIETGRIDIVNSFKALTTERGHARWQIK